MDDIKITEINVLSMAPGDTLVAHIDRHPTANEAEHISGVLRRVFPDNKVLVLSPGMKFEVVSS